MFRAMAIKELRETRGIAIVAMIVLGMLVMAEIDPNSSFNVFAWFLPGRSVEANISLVSDSFVGRFYLLSAALAIALGLRQSLGESYRGTYPFLFHRPTSRRWLIAVKLLVGSAMYLVCTTSALLWYTLWAATPGTHAGPFEWSMAAPVWAGWFAMTLVYLGAFLTGIRPGRWHVSRLLPLITAAVVAAGAVAGAHLFNTPPWLHLLVVAAGLWGISTILFVAHTRDYS